MRVTKNLKEFQKIFDYSIHLSQGMSSGKVKKNCQAKNAKKNVKPKRVARIGDSVFCNSPFERDLARSLLP
jgi:hypothetical protein